jgi:hypothetical protein
MITALPAILLLFNKPERPYRIGVRAISRQPASHTPSGFEPGRLLILSGLSEI